MSAEPGKPISKPWAAIGLVLVIATGVIAWSRVGLLDLPAAPSGVTVESAGLARLDDWRRADQWLQSAAAPADVTPTAVQVRAGIDLVQAGYVQTGLETIREGVRQEPENLVYSNAYRMVVFRVMRDYLREAKVKGDLTPKFPPHLERQSMAFFEELDAAHPCREAKLQLALSWVDQMLLFPALEIKAPSSVESVKILTGLIDDGNEAYVPALFARGLNHLHRPARLVWPESAHTPLDAAAQDIGRCVAIGRKLNVGSKRLQAFLALALGDAYVKAGKYNVARSWWQVARNLCGDAEISEAVRLRYEWRDEEILDRLEAELDRGRSELDQPMTDLAMMWK